MRLYETCSISGDHIHINDAVCSLSYARWSI